MWMNPYVEETLIRHQIADARRKAATRQLLRDAASRKAGTRPWVAMQQFIEAMSVLALKRRNERMVLR
jgi:hypothetical protein